MRPPVKIGNNLVRNIRGRIWWRLHGPAKIMADISGIGVIVEIFDPEVFALANPNFFKISANNGRIIRSYK